MASAPAANPATTDFSRARRAMIDSQLRTSGIGDAFVLNAMARVPRENYVAGDRRSVAYADRQVPLGEGRAMSSPVAHAMLLREARPRVSDKMLLVAGGTGYLAALFQPLVGSLDVVESDLRLPALSADKPGDWHDGDLAAGYANGAPYDLIVIDGSVEAVPPALAAQLADDGRIVTGLVDRGVTRIAIGRRSGKGVAMQPVAEIGLPVLDAFSAPKGWSF